MNKLTYVAPSLKVVEFKVEIGTALSGGFTKNSDAFEMDFDQTSNSPRNEQYQFSDDNSFWN